MFSSTKFLVWYYPTDDLPGNDVNLSIENDYDCEGKIEGDNCGIKLVDGRLRNQAKRILGKVSSRLKVTVYIFIFLIQIYLHSIFQFAYHMTNFETWKAPPRLNIKTCWKSTLNFKSNFIWEIMEINRIYLNNCFVWHLKPIGLIWVSFMVPGQKYRSGH